MAEAPAGPPEDWNKLDRIRYLLDHWQDIFDPSITSTWATFTGIGHMDSGSRTPSPLPSMAHSSTVRKLERGLSTLAEMEPVLARHLKAYRCNAEWRTTDRWMVRRLPSGKPDIVESRVREKIVPAWVERKKVELAELLLLRIVPGSVDIPRPLWLALTKP